MSRRPVKQKWLRGLLKGGAVYAVLTLGACQLAPSLMFHPEYGQRREPAGEVTLAMPDGTNVRALYLPGAQAALTVWYFHGNAEDLGDIEPVLHRLHDAGFAVFAADYPGYGRSPGKPTEESVYAAARVARAYLRKELKVPAERTLIFGRSLGGGPAVQMATEERVAGLILSSAFTSAFRVMTRWRLLPGDPFQNLPKVGAVGCPVLVMHGREDRVVPFHHGEALFAAAPEPKRSLWVDLAGHNDFMEMAGDAYWKALREFGELCAGKR